MNRSRRVKIVATLGPASNTKRIISKLCKSGADVFRINMSHTDHESLNQLVTHIREVESEVGTAIGILADIQGPKHRLGEFKDGEIKISQGDLITFDNDKTLGTQHRVHIPHPEILSALRVGHRILINDGRVCLEVVKKSKGKIVAKVINGDSLSDRKGINLPDSELTTKLLGTKDRKDLIAALEAGVDWLGLSFIQRPSDITSVRSLCKKHDIKGHVGIMAKIERPQAVNHLDEIIRLSDGIMVARGDLGVEMPLEMVPSLQKKMIRKSRKMGRPVIVATQMLESMVNHATPTRAEVTDVANAVYDGADAVMLSAESATGDYPVESVSVMDSIACAMEEDKGYRKSLESQTPSPTPTSADAISSAVAQISQTLDSSGIVCYTASGSTGLRVVRVRPDKPILALSPVPQTARRLALSWGIRCVITPDAKDLDDMVARACRIAVREKIAKRGDQIIITAGIPLSTSGSTNMVRIATIE